MPTSSFGFDKIRSIFFFSLIAILGFAVLYLLRPFAYPIFWAAILAVMFYPLYKKLLGLLKNQTVSSLITLLLIVIIIFLPLTILSTLIVNESINLYQSATEGNYVIGQVANVETWLNKTPLAPYLDIVKSNWTEYAGSATQSISIFIFNNLKSITQNSLTFFFLFFITLYSLFFFLRDGARMLKRLMRLSPLGDEYEAMLYTRFTSTARATLKGTLLIGGLQGILGGLLFWVTGIEGALIWGVIMILLSIIPAIGCSIVWFPTGIIMLAMGNIWQGVTILIFGLLVISTIDNLVRPSLVGKDIQLHPLLVLFSTLGGIFLFGISGFIIGPVLSALFVSVMSIYEHHYKKELNNN